MTSPESLLAVAKDWEDKALTEACEQAKRGLLALRPKAQTLTDETLNELLHTLKHCATSAAARNAIRGFMSAHLKGIRS